MHFQSLDLCLYLDNTKNLQTYIYIFVFFSSENLHACANNKSLLIEALTPSIRVIIQSSKCK